MTVIYQAWRAGKLIGSYGCATETSMKLDTDLFDTGRIARLRPGQSISVRSELAELASKEETWDRAYSRESNHVPEHSVISVDWRMA